MKRVVPPGWIAVRRLWLALGLLTAAGCTSLFPPEPPVEVSESQLNWLTIRYRPLAADHPPCRIEIVGAGYLQFAQGESPLVADDFAVDTEHLQWNHLTQEKLGMTPADARQMLQQFVDAGLLDAQARPRGADPGAPGIAACRWRINNRRGGCVTARPELTGLVEALAARLGRQER
jgi:hypothetical protein